MSFRHILAVTILLLTAVGLLGLVYIMDGLVPFLIAAGGVLAILAFIWALETLTGGR